MQMFSMYFKWKAYVHSIAISHNVKMTIKEISIKVILDFMFK